MLLGYVLVQGGHGNVVQLAVPRVLKAAHWLEAALWFVLLFLFKLR